MAGGISLVGTTEYPFTTAAASYACTVTAAAGTYAVAVVHLRTGATSNTTTVADSAGNTWTQRSTAVQSAVNSRIVIFTAPINSALSSGTVTVSTSASFAATINISVWSGVASVGTAVATNGTATTTPTSATVAVTRTGDAVVGGISYGSATAPTSLATGWTAMGGGSPGTVYYGANAYQIATGAGTIGPSWVTPSAGYAAISIPLIATTGSASVSATPGAATADLAVPSVFGRVVGGSMLSNGSFEVDTNSDGLCDSWEDEHTTATKPTYTQVTSGVVDGTYAQRMQYTGEVSNTGTQKVEIFQATPRGSMVAGDVLRFDLWLRGSMVGTYGIIGIETFDTSGVYQTEHDLTILPTDVTTTSTKFSTTFTVPSGASFAAIFLQCPELFPSSSLDLTMDAAVLVSVPPVSATVSAAPGQAPADAAAPTLVITGHSAAYGYGVYGVDWYNSTGAVQGAVTAAPGDAQADEAGPAVTGLTLGSVSAVPGQATADTAAPTVAGLALGNVSAAPGQATADAAAPAVAGLQIGAVAAAPGQATANAAASTVIGLIAHLPGAVSAAPANAVAAGSGSQVGGRAAVQAVGLAAVADEVPPAAVGIIRIQGTVSAASSLAAADVPVPELRMPASLIAGSIAATALLTAALIGGRAQIAAVVGEAVSDQASPTTLIRPPRDITLTAVLIPRRYTADSLPRRWAGE